MVPMVAPLSAHPLIHSATPLGESPVLPGWLTWEPSPPEKGVLACPLVRICCAGAPRTMRTCVC